MLKSLCKDDYNVPLSLENEFFGLIFRRKLEKTVARYLGTVKTQTTPSKHKLESIESQIKDKRNEIKGYLSSTHSNTKLTLQLKKE